MSRAPKGNGMYYHADLSLRCPGVDFLCPRGWCYATRCKFYGDSRAMVWHDGRGDKSRYSTATSAMPTPTRCLTPVHGDNGYISTTAPAKAVTDCG